MIAELDLVKSETAFNEYAPQLYSTNVEHVGLLFYPRRDLLIVDAREPKTRYVSTYQHTPPAYDFTKMGEVIARGLEKSNLFVLDMKNLCLVYDILTDTRLTWYEEPAFDSADCVVFSGDKARHLFYSCYSTSKMAVYGVNVLSKFDTSIPSIAGMNCLLGYFNQLVGTDQSYTISDAIRQFSFPDVDPEYCYLYNTKKFYKVIQGKKPVKQPVQTSQPALLPAPANETLSLAALIGAETFDIDGVVNLDIPVPEDILWMRVNKGLLTVCRSLLGRTEITHLVDDYSWPHDKISMIFSSERSTNAGTSVM